MLLERAGANVSVVARGPHLEAMRNHGLALILDGEELVSDLPATDDARALGKQDAVIVTLKAHSISAAVPGIRALLGRDTAVVSAVNGIPLVVLPSPRFPVRRAPCRERRSRRCHLAQHRTRAGRRLRGLSLRGDRRTRGRPALVGQQDDPRRTVRRTQRAGHRAGVVVHGRGHQGAHPPKTAQRDLDEALGQRGIQPAYRH